MLKLSAFARFPKEQEKSNSVGLIRATYILIPKNTHIKGQKRYSVRIIDIVAVFHLSSLYFEWVCRFFESILRIAYVTVSSYLE